MTYTFKLSPTFYDDTKHCQCFTDEPAELKRTKREVTVSMSERDTYELYDRAKSYVDGAYDYIAAGSGGWVTAARATLKRMAAQGYGWQQARDYRDKMRAAA